jgi:RimJ/RimL family protein N-acetyltransferase
MAILKSSDIVLAPITKADLPALWTWINDRSDVLWNSAYRPVDELSHRAWFERIRTQTDVVMFAIRSARTRKLVGSCQLRDIDRVHRTAELQIRIGEQSARGRGWGTQAVRLLMRFAFDDLNLQRVGLRVFATNHRAIRAYEKAGFVREGTLRRAAHIDGAYVDVVVMGLLREPAA